MYSVLSLLAVFLYSLSGVVKDNSDLKPLSDAAVEIEKEGQTIKWSVSDKNGNYHIEEIPQGEYTIVISFVGYKTLTHPVFINSDISMDFRLIEENETLDEVIISAVESRGVTSSTKIGTDAIKHIQPSSFADLLELLPGGMAKDPSLGSPQIINLRSANTLTNSDYATSALGTKFIIDGRPINNDANLQSSPVYSNYGSSYVNFGTDMREISTEDIEKVDIVRGIASVKYGDLTSGLINIVRKRGGNDIHARFKSDMKSKLFYLGKGFEWADGSNKTTLNTSVNYLDSRIDPRQTRQNWKRLTTNIRFSKGNLSASFDYTGSFDNQKSDADMDIAEGGTPIETYKSSYNKLAFSGNYSIHSDNDNSIFRSWENIASISYEIDKIDRWKHVSLGKSTPVSNSISEGEHDALIIPAKYDATLQVDGKPFYSFISSTVMFAKGDHTIQTGVQWNLDKNYGRGTIFDSSRPFSVGMNVRPRPYNAIPANHRLSAFIEDNIHKEIGKWNLVWVLGLRAESLAGAGADYSINLKPFIDPRTNIRLEAPSMIICERKMDIGTYIGIGKHTKFPTMDMLYPDPLYGDITQLNYWPAEPELRRVNMLVYKIDPTNYELKPASNLKWEIGGDMAWNGFTFNIDYFQEDMKSGFRYGYEYISIESKIYDTSNIDKNSLAGPPSLEDLSYKLDTTLNAYSFTTNGSRTLKRGIEFSFSSKRIKAINTKITANGAWFRTKYSNSTPEYYRPSIMINGKMYPYIGIYNKNDGSYYDSMVTNIMFDTQIPSLGLIFSTSLQTCWFSGHRSLPDSKYPNEYIDKAGKRHKFDKDKDIEDAVLKHLVKNYTDSLYKYQRTPFAMNINLKVMKKLYHDKISCSLYVNKLFDITPDYYRNGVLVRRNVTPYFGMELDFKL